MTRTLNLLYPCCTVHYVDHLPEYTVYDRFGSIMVRTGSLRVANQFLKLARRGISAQLYGLMEKWNYRIPRYIVDQL